MTIVANEATEASQYNRDEIALQIATMVGEARKAHNHSWIKQAFGNEKLDMSLAALLASDTSSNKFRDTGVTMVLKIVSGELAKGGSIVAPENINVGHLVQLPPDRWERFLGEGDKTKLHTLLQANGLQAGNPGDAAVMRSRIVPVAHTTYDKDTKVGDETFAPGAVFTLPNVKLAEDFKKAVAVVFNEGKTPIRDRQLNLPPSDKKIVLLAPLPEERGQAHCRVFVADAVLKDLSDPQKLTKFQDVLLNPSRQAAISR